MAAECAYAVFVAARMEQGMAFARHLRPDRSEPAEQQAHLQAAPVLRLAVDAERRQQAAGRELRATLGCSTQANGNSLITAPNQ